MNLSNKDGSSLLDLISAGGKYAGDVVPQWHHSPLGHLESAFRLGLGADSGVAMAALNSARASCLSMHPGSQMGFTACIRHHPLVYIWVCESQVQK